jgi:hypothetical protein
MTTELRALSVPPPATVARATVAAPPRLRFTVDGSVRLENHLAQTCARIAAGLRSLLPRRKLVAIVLGGGYGRGEGGVWRAPDGDRPYNDLEFYVCLRGNRHLNERIHGRALHVLGEILTPQAGVEVEFKIASLRELAAGPVSMFSYDLVSGHRWLVGDEEFFAPCAHHRDATQIPLAEATRLLMNRGSGLLLAEARLGSPVFAATDADFVARNIAKMQLALGDAVLVSRGRYHWSARQRHARLGRLALAENTAWLNHVSRHHATGLEFKLHPCRSTASRAELAALHREVKELARETWLWIEAQRLRQPFRSIRDYVDSPVPKADDSPAWRNPFLHARALGLRRTDWSRALRHPRERVLHALALLLWDCGDAAPAETLRRVQRELRTDAREFPELVRVYEQLWRHVQ